MSFIRVDSVTEPHFIKGVIKTLITIILEHKYQKKYLKYLFFKLFVFEYLTFLISTKVI